MRTKSHYRRISKSALQAFQMSLKDPRGPVPREDVALGSIGAVVVGTELGGYRILEVVGADREGLPGDFCADAFRSLTGAARAAVRRVEIRELEDDPDNPGQQRMRKKLVPENTVDEKKYGVVPDPEKEETVAPSAEDEEAIVAVGVNPHRFI